MTGGGFFNVLWERAISIKTIGMMIWLYDDMVAWFFLCMVSFFYLYNRHSLTSPRDDTDTITNMLVCLG